MQKFRKIIIPFALIASVLLAFNQVGAISIKELLGLGDDTAEENANADKNEAKAATGDNQNWAQQENPQGDLSLDFTNIKQIVTNLSVNERNAFLNNEENFKQFVQQQAANLSVLTAARVNNLDEDQNTVFLIQLSAENILRETYLNKLIASKIPADFPTEAQIQEYYDNNKASFFLGERVHVWQIFLTVNEDMDANTIASIEKKISQVQKDIKDKKIDFGDAAMKYSEHLASKTNGGYMGLIKVSDLKPALSEPLMKLAEGELSTPVKSDTGIHILKRGAIIPRQDVSLEQVKNQIRELLVNQATTQLRQAIYNQAAKTYPVEISDQTIEQWRLRLKTNM